MRLHPLLAFLAILALSLRVRLRGHKGGVPGDPLRDARVRIHYASGLKAEVDPIDLDNITTEVNVLPDGRRVAHKWVGGLLPLENPLGQYVYADKDATKLRLEAGETRQFSFSFNSSKGAKTSGTLEVAIKSVERAALGECQATFVNVVITTNWAQTSQSARISRLFIKEIGFFVASRVERMKDGKPEVVDFAAMRLELIR